MKVLFLDDRQERIDVAEERYKDDELTVVRTVEEAISELRDKWVWDLVCLDHDLGGESFVDPRRADCGMEVVRWMVGDQGPIGRSIPRKTIIHTSNFLAALQMYSVLNAYGYYVIYERFRYE